jgi:hypothetical protein
VWLAAIGPGGPARRAGIAAAIVAAAILPLVLIVDLAARLEVGVAIPWHLLLRVTGGETSFPAAVIGCLIAGGLVALVAAAQAPEEAAVGPRIAAKGPG